VVADAAFDHAVALQHAQDILSQVDNPMDDEQKEMTVRACLGNNLQSAGLLADLHKKNQMQTWTKFCSKPLI
jgi:hypothetical protein